MSDPGGTHVLHVDDDRDFADMVADALEHQAASLSVESAPTASEALDLLDAAEFDCIVSDYDMPDQNGIEFLETIREEYPDLPFILFTGKGSEAVASEAISAGVTDYLQKDTGTGQYELLANRIENAVAQYRAEQRATQTATRYAALFETLGEPAVEVTFDGATAIVQSVNDAFETTFGVAASTIRGDSLDEHIVPEDDRDTARDLNQQVRDGAITERTLHRETVDGRGTFLLRTVPFTVDGERRAFAIYLDITDRTQQREQFQAFIEHSTDVISVLDPDGTYQYQSPSVERVLGYDPEEMVGDTAFEYVHPDDRAEVVETFEAAVSDPTHTPTAEYRFRHADGSWRWLESIGNNQLDNPAVEGFVVNSRDITERRQRAAAIEALHSTVREFMTAETATGVADTAVEAARDILGLPVSGVYFYDEDDCLAPVAWTDEGEALVGDPPTFSAGEGLAWQVFDRGEAQAYGDVSSVAGRINPDTNVGSELILPLGNHGVLMIGSAETDAFDETDRSLAETLATYVTTTLDRLEREQTLHEYEALVETVGDPMYVLDEDGSIQRANDAFLAYIDADRSDLIGAHPSEFLSPGDFERGTALLREILKDPDREWATYEVTVVTTTGERKPAEINLAPLTDDTGGVTGSVGVLRDISERKDREQKLTALHDVADDLTASESVAEICERTVEASKTILDFDLSLIDIEEDGMLSKVAASEELPGEDMAEMSVEEGIAGKTYRTGESFLIEDLTDHPDAEPQGSYRAGMSVPIGDHGVFQAVAEPPGVFDETDLELAELLVSHAEQALDRATRERELETLRGQMLFALQTTDSYVWTADLESGATDLYGSPDPLSGMQEFERLADFIATVVHPDDRDRLEQRYAALRHGETDEFVAEFRTAPDLGEIRWMHAEGYRQTEDGTATVVGLTTDITERKRREQELQRQNDRLEEFVGIVSHDLRNPLNVATGRLELAQRECDSAYLDDVAEAHDRMEQLITDLLTLARQGKQVGDVEAVELAPMVDRCWGTVETGDATLITETEQTIQADRNRLRELLENLMRNAVDHSGDAVTVTVGELADNSGFYVADDGAGIPEEEREDVFEAGFSTAEEGTGFGLNIVEEIAEAHGWNVHIVESEGGGARFEITDVTVADTP